MFWLWRAKGWAARALDSRSLEGDAACSLACIQLSSVLFAGSLLFLALQEVLAVLQQGAALMDLRSDERVELKGFAVPSVFHIPHRSLGTCLSDLPKDKPLVLADTCGVYTKVVARLLLESGFAQVV
jgi:rhodanese-related sulfurtransferase